MRFNMKTNLQSRLLLVLLLLSTGLTACIGVNANGNTSGKVQTISLSPISSTSSVTSSVAHPVSDSVLDGIVKEALVSINQYGWGDYGRNGPGIYINWYRNDPTAHQNPGHDGQNDIRDYENMVWYEARHPGDTSLLAAIARLLPDI